MWHDAPGCLRNLLVEIAAGASCLGQFSQMRLLETRNHTCNRGRATTTVETTQTRSRRMQYKRQPAGALEPVAQAVCQQAYNRGEPTTMGQRELGCREDRY